MARTTYARTADRKAEATVHLSSGTVERIVFHETPPHLYDQIRAIEKTGERGSRWKTVAGVTFFRSDDQGA